MPRRILFAWSAFNFEILIALMCALSGLPLAFGALPSPNAVYAVMPHIIRVTWGICLAVGGVTVITGILWRYYDREQFIPGLYIERSGLWLLSGAVIAFAIAIFVYAGGPSFLTVAIYIAFVLACLSRSHAIGKEIATIREYGTDE